MDPVGFDWNVVVVGFWNPAILTPAGIGKRLFELEQGTPVELEVPMDGLAPYRVSHEEITVTAERGRLTIYSKKPNYAQLDRARSVAIRAIEGLPETPVTAAGFNIRIKVESLPELLLPAITPKFDALLSDADFSIETRVLGRTLKLGNGILNLSIEQAENLKVILNFHRQSTKTTELVSWLRQPMDSVQSTVSCIFEKVIGIPLGELGK
jgi:hypothetical protein